ncbi:MAG: Gldg family protein [Proteobacteria bacterium]|nr:Gldg family protein [Pseudomonadota bacterium]
MRSQLFIIPFIAILFAAFGTMFAGSYADKATMWYAIGWGGAAVALGLWGWLDRKGFVAVFNRKGAKYGASSGLVVILGFLVILGIAVLTAKPRFDKSIDLSRDKTNTLSEQSIKAIETLTKKDAEASATAYFIDQAQETQFRDLLNLYLKSGAKLKVEYINPQKDPTKALADKLTSANTVIFRYGAQENRLTTFTEEKVTNALINILKEKSKKVYFTKGHGEGQITGTEATGFDSLVQELKNNRFDIADVNLLETGKVADDATALVVAGPKYDLKDIEGKAIEAFVQKGGSVVVMVDAMVPATQINQTFSKFGFQFNNDFIILRPDDPRAQLMGQNNAIVSEFDDFSPVTKDFAKKSNVAVLLQNTRTISEVPDNAAKLKISLIGKTSTETGIKLKNVNSQADLKNLSPDRIEQGSFAVIASATGKQSDKEVRVLGVGSVQFATNQGAQAGENRDLFINMINYLSQDDDFISIRPKDPTKSTLSVTSGGAILNLKFISFVYPFIFLGFGVLYWMRRRAA